VPAQDCHSVRGERGQVERLTGGVIENGKENWLARALQSIAHMSLKTDELKDRIQAKKHELLARLNELKADNRADAAEQRSKIKVKLDELENTLKEGWDKAAAKLNTWLNRDNN
jgi:hypothetical protein